MDAATLSTRWSACPLDKDAKRHVMVQISPGPGIAGASIRDDEARQLLALRINVIDLTRGVWSEALTCDGLVKRRQECAPFLDLDHTDLVNELVAAVNAAEAPACSFSWTVRGDGSTADLIVKRNLGALSFSWRFSVRLLPYNDAFLLVGNALLMPLLCLTQVYEHRLAHAEDVIKRQEVNNERLLALVPNLSSYHAKPVRPYDESQLPAFALSNTLFTSRYWHQATVDLELGDSQSSTQPPPLAPMSSSQAAVATGGYTSRFASSTANSFSQALAGTARVTAAPLRPAAPHTFAPTASSQPAAPSSQLPAPPTSNSQVYGAPSHSQTNGTSQFNDASSHSLFALFNIPTSDGPTAQPARKPAELNLDLPSSPTTAASPPPPLHLPLLGPSATTGSRYLMGPEPPSDPATSMSAPPPPPAPAPAPAPTPVKAGFYIPGVAKIRGSSSSGTALSMAPVGAMPPPPLQRSALAAETRSALMQPPAGADSRPAPAKSDSEPARKKQKRKALF
ncbi:hypothetical protein AMAG_02190 [Allomyces macrogynus ATCC 38327]|uniref:Uncharacterized protein n=1 Tax=Allomyces macrogynus (strain ATCC 38327) TaxID=578462 RepID=A0A0L0S1Y7_ALLM3|nr:hypothetical protein AMAG_02190 [Allomyces macrogynus ATCC 38327]|eukprot:KNE56379.1 hypothetical protein AMAG_02190 [Allomyces macrogynus ATCC 38327]